eukprot:MONOS_408.1-p1 / transcript=MONOS_408.1 / gene=MONOS_408 / organism=Monocercomonoides_exilis_PA203 / gene_product=unspecified product / transcript_product=unspecified product / location=Mono_scaffold00006:283471-284076(+) / protein_length=202 / sequence_SO=supercontig / SO=protein_coding / is_pseudo=false
MNNKAVFDIIEVPKWEEDEKEKVKKLFGRDIESVINMHISKKENENSKKERQETENRKNNEHLSLSSSQIDSLPEDQIMEMFNEKFEHLKNSQEKRKNEWHNEHIIAYDDDSDTESENNSFDNEKEDTEEDDEESDEVEDDNDLEKEKEDEDDLNVGDNQEEVFANENVFRRENSILNICNQEFDKRNENESIELRDMIDK